MSATDKTQYGKTTTDDTLIFGALAALAAACVIAFASLWIGSKLAGLPTDGLYARMQGGDVVWPQEATYAAVGLVVAALVLYIAYALRGSRKGGSKAVDRAAPYMASDASLRDLTAKGRKAEAKNKHLPITPLPMLAETMTGMALHVGPESTATVIAGPRAGKTTSLAVPRICEWDGPVVVTSNKRDLVDDTRAWRERDGDTSWVFDPMGITGEEASWYWDPVSYVTTGPADLIDVRAASLAHRFAFATDQGSKSGGYFTISGEGLVAALILACALDGRSILGVRKWVTNPINPAPVEVLRDHGFTHVADALQAMQDLNGDQRQGIFGTADTMTKFLTYRSVHRWITKGDTDRPEFKPREFVRSHDTLYSISRETTGSMGPLVTALTVAVCEAAEELAQSTPGGRLVTPMGVVLDEVANVCKWDDLPNVYSHYGSKGIILISFLQSWNQGVEVWGEHGMGMLWSASTTRIIGPGVAENGFLASTSDMIGQFTKPSHSTSKSKSGGSTSVQEQKDTILTVSDLTALPPGRAILVESGHKPVLVKLVGWYDRKYSADLKKAKAAA